uniref:Transcription factor bHLH69 n=1 Tax=Noccaea caerulescens TaxID=107243 RepID=A0A1J3EDV1_NOCCA
MERGMKLGTVSRNHPIPNRQSGGASSQVKVEDEETNLSLSQWLHPSKLPVSYTAFLNEESTPDEKPPVDYVVERVVLPSRDGARGGIRTLYSASETEITACSKVKPSIRVQSRSINEDFGSNSKVKFPVAGRSSRKSKHSSSQNYSEKLRSWKERSENKNNNNRDFSQLHGKYRDVASKQSNRNKSKTWTTEHERKHQIEDNIKALGELLPHEVEGTPEFILNDVIARVKLLQLQMKELSRSRLGGEPISHPMISIEGYGHFIHQEHTMITKPLEEIMADLLTNDHDAATTLLESKGLFLMPFSSVQGFC